MMYMVSTAVSLWGWEVGYEQNKNISFRKMLVITNDPLVINIFSTLVMRRPQEDRNVELRMC